MAAPGQEKPIICNDTFIPTLNFWLGSVAEEIICQSEEKRCFGLEAERGIWDGPHMKDPVCLFALIIAGPGWEEIFHVCTFGVSSCISVCLFSGLVLIDDSQFTHGCFQFCSSHVTWRTCVHMQKLKPQPQMTDLDTIFRLSVTGVALIPLNGYIR